MIHPDLSHAHNGPLSRMFRASHMHYTSDSDLLKAYRVKGDQEAFAELWQRHGEMVLKAALAVVGNAEEAEDIAQATFQALTEKAPSFEDTESIGGWLCHVAVCLARNERRNRIRRTAHEKRAGDMAERNDRRSTVPEDTLAALYEEIAAFRNLTNSSRPASS